MCVCMCVCFATVSSTEMWGRDEFSEKGEEETTARPFSKSNTRRNTRMTRESEILINNSGIRAINRQCLIFKTLEGVESAEVENWRLAFK